MSGNRGRRNKGSIRSHVCPAVMLSDPMGTYGTSIRLVSERMMERQERQYRNGKVSYPKFLHGTNLAEINAPVYREASRVLSSLN